MSAIAAAAIAAGGALAGGYMSSQAAGKAAGQAADATKAAAKALADTQRYMFDKSMRLTAPQREMFDFAAPYLKEGLGSAQASLGGYVDQYNALDPRAGTPDMPVLQDRVNWDMENDPIFQMQKADMLKTLNRRYATMGRGASSDADNAVVNNMAGLATDSYGRAVGDMERGNQNALTQYGLGYQRSADMYGRDTSRLMDLFNLTSNINNQDYGRALDMAKIGSSAAASAGQNALATGQGLASTFQNQGNDLASIFMNQSRNQAGIIDDTLGGIGGALNNYQLMQLYKQMPAMQPATAGGPVA